jgi:hypothetical protein
MALAVGLRADEVPAVGAKEMFFDPQRGVAEASTASTPAKITDEDGRRIAQLSPETPILGLSYWIELIAGAGKRGVHVTDDRAFRSGERIRLHFRGNADGRIVIVQLGTSGASTVLFPDAGKGLGQNRIRANRDHVLPSEAHWFRFDDKAGTEKLLVLFARNQEELDRAFPTQPVMDPTETATLLRAVRQSRGGKDLLIEKETREPSEIGDYVVNVAGKPIALEIALAHR